MTDTGNYPVQLSPIVVLTLISKFQSEIINPTNDQIKHGWRVFVNIVRVGNICKTG